MQLIGRFVKKLFVALVLILAAVTLAVSLMRYLYPKQYSEHVEDYASQYGLDADFVYAVIKCESNFNKDAVSSADARGLMQITYDTLEWVALRENESGFTQNSLFEPAFNVRIGCALYSILFDEFGDTKTVLAAYNAGRGNVLKWLSDSALSYDGKTLDSVPYAETENYIDKVMTTKKIYELIY